MSDKLTPEEALADNADLVAAARDRSIVILDFDEAQRVIVELWDALAASQERERELEARAAALRKVASDAYRDERTGNARVWRTGGLVLDTTPEEYVEHLVMNNRAPEPPREEGT